jgi:hypothetical protein
MSEEKKVKKNNEFTITQTGQVINAAGVMVTNNPMPRHRPWIKLWVDPWLDGTTRWQTTGAQRAFWVDLMTEAARGRFPGYICAGQDAGQAVGYPLKWYQAKQSEDLDILEAFELFERTGKIRIIRTSLEPLLVAIEILNWDLYQPAMDQAERARNYRDRKKKL